MFYLFLCYLGLIPQPLWARFSRHRTGGAKGLWVVFFLMFFMLLEGQTGTESEQLHRLAPKFVLFESGVNINLIFLEIMSFT